MELFHPLWRLLLEFAALSGFAWGIRRLTVSTQRRMQRYAAAWPTVQGTVEHATPKMEGEGRTGYWVGELSYSYSVDGEYYAGVAQLPARDEDAAYEAVRGWKDRKVSIRYALGRPSLSTLIFEEQSAPICSQSPNKI
jgi:hypothetical protein